MASLSRKRKGRKTNKTRKTYITSVPGLISASTAKAVLAMRKLYMKRKKQVGGVWPFSEKTHFRQITEDGEVVGEIADPDNDYNIIHFFKKMINGGKRYFLILRDYGQKLIDVLREEQNTGNILLVTDTAPDQLKGIIEWGGKFAKLTSQRGVTDEINKYRSVTLSGRFHSLFSRKNPPPPQLILPPRFAEHYSELSVAKRRIPLPGNFSPVNTPVGDLPIVDEEGKNKIQEADVILNESNVLSALVSPPNPAKEPIGQLGPPTYFSELNPYEKLLDREDMIPEIISTFIKRYDLNKLNNPAKHSKTAQKAHVFAISLLALKGLMNAAKLTLTLFTSLTTFGIGGGLVYTVLNNLGPIVNKGQSVEVYINSTNDAILLLSPHKLWTDPQLKIFARSLIPRIREDPSILKDLPGYSIEVVEKRGNSADDMVPIKFSIFKNESFSEYDNDDCNDSSKILNLIFSSTDPGEDITEFISEEIHNVLVLAAQFKRNQSSSVFKTIFRHVFEG